MRCKKIRKYFYGYIDGSLTGDKNKLVAEHLAECESCCKHIEQLISVISGTKLIPREIDPSDDFWKEIFETISMNSPKGPGIYEMRNVSYTHKSRSKPKHKSTSFYSSKNIIVIGWIILTLALGVLFSLLLYMK